MRAFPTSSRWCNSHLWQETRIATCQDASYTSYTSAIRSEWSASCTASSVLQLCDYIATSTWCLAILHFALYLSLILSISFCGFIWGLTAVIPDKAVSMGRTHSYIHIFSRDWDVSRVKKPFLLKIRVIFSRKLRRSQAYSNQFRVVGQHYVTIKTTSDWKCKFQVSLM